MNRHEFSPIAFRLKAAIRAGFIHFLVDCGNLRRFSYHPAGFYFRNVQETLADLGAHIVWARIPPDLAAESRMSTMLETPQTMVERFMEPWLKRGLAQLNADPLQVR